MLPRMVPVTLADAASHHAPERHATVAGIGGGRAGIIETTFKGALIINLLNKLAGTQFLVFKELKANIACLWKSLTR